MSTPDFVELKEPQSFTAESPEGQLVVKVTNFLGATAAAFGMQPLVNSFAYYFAHVSIHAGMDEAVFEQAISEMQVLFRANRAHMQRTALERASIKTS